MLPQSSVFRETVGGTCPRSLTFNYHRRIRAGGHKWQLGEENGGCEDARAEPWHQAPHGMTEKVTDQIRQRMAMPTPTPAEPTVLPENLQAFSPDPSRGGKNSNNLVNVGKTEQTT